MTDRELLELAAKAAGIVLEWDLGTPVQILQDRHSEDEVGTYAELWNPLADDGDALRLAVKTQMWLDMASPTGGIHAEAFHAGDGTVDVFEDGDGDQNAKTRRAIVRAAALKGM